MTVVWEGVPVVRDAERVDVGGQDLRAVARHVGSATDGPFGAS